VLQSRAFSSSRALQGFLQFVTDRAISGDLHAIREQRIGCEVLGRRGDYDPAEDNIVRVRAHELRQKLAKYFSIDGAAEPFVITIPKGGYIPAFIPRPSEPAPGQPEKAATPSPKSPGIPQWVPWALVSILLVVVAFRALVPAGMSSAAKAAPVPSAAIRDLWAQFFRDNDRDLTVVSADSGFALWQDVTGRNVELGDYITRKFVQDAGSPQFGEVASRLCTSPADLSVALEVADVGAGFRGHVRPRYARDITAGELRTGNAVLMGSRRSNPWVGLFEARMNFVLARDGKPGAPDFLNKAPKPGEPADFGIPSRFDSAGAEKQQMVSYAVAALVPNLSGTGLVLILEGLNMEGTAAIGDVVTNPDKLAILLRKLGHQPGTAVKPFEALVKLTSVPGGFAFPEVIATRYSEIQKP
jgi:hypothetical protein